MKKKKKTKKTNDIACFEFEFEFDLMSMISSDTYVDKQGHDRSHFWFNKY